MFASNYRLQVSWSIQMLPKARFHYLSGNRERAMRGELRNCAYETALIAQDAETCLHTKPTATSDWRTAKLSAFAANESPTGSLFKAYLTLILLTWKIW